MEAIRGHLVKKGDVLTVAEVAGTLAAKRTGELIPLCHPIGIDKQMTIGEIRLVEKRKEAVE